MSEVVERPRIININDRRVVCGPDDGLMQIAPLKHPKAMEVYLKMRADAWSMTDVNLNDDVPHWPMLNASTQIAYQKALSSLSNLDGMQLYNLTKINEHCTSPEYKMALAQQSADEAFHVLAYQTQIETMSLDPVEIYNLFVTNEILAAKNAYVRDMGKLLANDDDPVNNYIRAVVFNQVLEGLLFQSGFLVFYAISEATRRMNASAKNIGFIHRDEQNHLRLFFYMYEDLKQEYPKHFTPQLKRELSEILRRGTEMEKLWGKDTVSGGIMGLTDRMVYGYVDHLADYFAEGLEVPTNYGSPKNPVPWIEKRLKENGVDTNFFESRVMAYDTGTLEW